MAVKKARCVIAIAPADADVYASWIPREKMLVIPQGFDERQFNPWYPPPRNARKTILFCGNFKIQTNREVVDTVMRHILQPVLAKYPDALFRFVGSWPPSDIKHPNIEFTGFLEDYPAALKGADVVISPMRQGWGFPTKIVEALACGKPTVTTPVGGRALEKDYHILKFAEIDAFAAEICRNPRRRPARDGRGSRQGEGPLLLEANVRRLSNWIENDASKHDADRWNGTLCPTGPRPWLRSERRPTLRARRSCVGLGGSRRSMPTTSRRSTLPPAHGSRSAAIRSSKARAIARSGCSVCFGSAAFPRLPRWKARSPSSGGMRLADGWYCCGTALARSPSTTRIAIRTSCSAAACATSACSMDARSSSRRRGSSSSSRTASSRADATLDRDVWRVPAGSYVQFDPITRKTSVEPWYRLSYAQPLIHDEATITRRYRELLEAAVVRRAQWLAGRRIPLRRHGLQLRRHVHATSPARRDRHVRLPMRRRFVR